jgi:hypothetical protein
MGNEIYSASFCTYGALSQAPWAEMGTYKRRKPGGNPGGNGAPPPIICAPQLISCQHHPTSPERGKQKRIKVRLQPVMLPSRQPDQAVSAIYQKPNPNITSNYSALLRTEHSTSKHPAVTG